MPDEIPPSEIPGPQVPAPNQTTPSVPPAPAAPPAAALVTSGEVTDERALALVRRAAEIERREAVARDVELNLSAKERKIQEREAALAGAKPPKAKRTLHWSDPVFSNEDENE